MGLIFFQRLDDLNPGRLGGKCERFLCAMPSPLPEVNIKWSKTNEFWKKNVKDTNSNRFRDTFRKETTNLFKWVPIFNFSPWVFLWLWCLRNHLKFSIWRKKEKAKSHPTRFPSVDLFLRDDLKIWVVMVFIRSIEPRRKTASQTTQGLAVKRFELLPSLHNWMAMGSGSAATKTPDIKAGYSQTYVAQTRTMKPKS